LNDLGAVIREKNMRRFKVGKSACDGKQFNPIRVVIPCRKRKCGKESAQLYQLLSGGLIHTRCSACGKDNPFYKEDFEFLPPYLCPECHKEMKPEQLKEDGMNACYTCRDCCLYIRLADLLPD
jgi:hypothetical protein